MPHVGFNVRVQFHVHASSEEEAQRVGLALALGDGTVPWDVTVEPDNRDECASEGVERQDRKSYTDTQDRDAYTPDGGSCD